MKIKNEIFADVALINQLDAHPASLVDYYLRNKGHLAAAMPQRDPEFYTEGYWRDQLRNDRAAFAAGKELRFVMMRNNHVIGSIHYDQVIGGNFRACYLGYSVDLEYQGRGLMRMALSQTIGETISRFSLNRIMASYEPSNTRSGKLLTSLGFEREGFARKYLKLNGAWRDHILTSYVAD